MARLAVKCGIAAVTLVISCSPRDHGRMGHTGANHVNDSPTVKSIPLETVYSTNEQKGLRDPWPSPGAAYEREFKQLRERSQQMGASNMFLVRGDSIGEAITATSKAILGVSRVERAVKEEWNSKSNQEWLMVYFGVAGSGGRWQVNLVQVRNRTIRLTYSTREIDNRDLEPYYVWAPLGQLNSGKYVLELFDSESNEVVLMRKVVVD